MSDTDFVDIGDELVVRISGYPVGKARVVEITSDAILTEFNDADGRPCLFELPLNVKDYDTIDGYGHHSQPLSGTAPVDEELSETWSKMSRELGKKLDHNGDTWENEGGRI